MAGHGRGACLLLGCAIVQVASSPLFGVSLEVCLGRLVHPKTDTLGGVCGFQSSCDVYFSLY
ncbi:hypothetical protein KC19_1G165300 [Ceratodon purpureus]|uniref:Uncharacterized protein n=1 Tax=Ceratodon purpureus TaxID=3225 RepID=A0A8T0J6P9_CERPU|nr:hypothetical protein KC19_1G165300 [Ceratodon purpureus]